MTNKIYISLPEFNETLKAFGKATKTKKNADVFLYMTDGELHLAHVGVDIAVNAIGQWNGQARLSLTSLSPLIKVPPLADPVVIEAETDRLKIGSTVIPSTWEPSIPLKTKRSKPIPAQPTVAPQSPPLITRLPINPPLSLLVAMTLDLTNDQIATSGVAHLVRSGRTRKEYLIDQAAHILRELDIKPADIRKLVDERLKGKSKPFFK